MAFINSGWHVGSETRADPLTLGGTETTYGSFKIHTFLTSGTFTYSGASSNITGNILSVAGGGSGGGGGNGAGGAGGMVVENLSIAPGVYSIVVGAGGPGHGFTGTQGFNSQTNIASETVAIGGGLGHNGNGGSGGGGSVSGHGGGLGTAGQGING